MHRLSDVPLHEMAYVPDGARPFAETARAQDLPDHVREGTTHLAVSIQDRVDPDAWPDLEVLVTRSDGFDHLPLEVLAKAGVRAYHLGDYAVPAVVEHTLGLLWATLRRVPEAMDRTRVGRWDRRDLVSMSIPDARIAVVGTGRIGSEVARRAQQLGAQVRGHDLAPDAGLGIEYDDLHSLASWCDAMTLHVPLTPQTRHLVDAEVVEALGPACLINTARGAVVDEVVVAESLRTGHLGGYGADVIGSEPAGTSLDLFRDAPRTLFTPHIAAYDAGTLRERYSRTWEILSDPDQADWALIEAAT